MSILDKLLAKRGIKNEDELSPEEKADFYRFKKILAGGDMTVDRIREFCEDKCTSIEKQWRGTDNSFAKNDRLVTMHTVFSMIIEAIDLPQLEREQVEREIEHLISK